MSRIRSRKQGQRHRWWVLAVLVLVGLGPLGGDRVPVAQAQEEAPEQRGRVGPYAVDGRDLVLDVTLPRALWGVDLEPDAFEVLEGDEVRAAEVRLLRNDELEIMLVVDPGLRGRGLVQVAGALREFIVALPAPVRIGLVAATSEPQVLVAPTTDRQAVVGALGQLRSSGERSVLRGIAAALDQFGEGTTRPTLVVVQVPLGDRSSQRAALLADRLDRDHAALYEVEVQQTLLGGSAPSRLPLPVGSGQNVRVATIGEVLPFLDTVSFGLAQQYRITTRFQGQGDTGAFVQIRQGGTTTGLAVFVGLPSPAPELPEPPPPRPVALVLLALFGGAVVVLLLVLAPPRVARWRKSRWPDPAPLAGLDRGVDASVPAPPGTREPMATPPPSPLGGTEVVGRTAVTELLRTGGRQVHEVWLVADGDGPEPVELLALAAGRRTPVRRVPGHQLAAMRGGEGSEVLAYAAPLRVASVEELVLTAGTLPPLVLGVDGPLEGEPLGHLLRAAEEAGATGVVLVRGRRDPVTPAATVAARGAVERLPIALVPSLALAAASLRRTGTLVVGLDPSGKPPRELPELHERPLVLLLAGEGVLERRVLHRCSALTDVGDGPLEDRIARLGAVLPRPAAAFSDRSGRAGR